VARDKIKRLDYSHRWTTAYRHIVEIYCEARKRKGQKALELGSFRGHASYAICLAGMDLTYYDLHKKHQSERDRLLKGFNVKYYIERGDEEFSRDGTYDLIFHDSYHTPKVAPELKKFYDTKLNSGGVLIVHDIHVNRELIVSTLSCEHIITQDKRGRELGCFYKNILSNA
jgi:predicted O-methyltransferase YrrM